MNYPVWDIPFLGSGLVVAIIAVIHILIAHVAIGGGAFLFIAEIWSDRQINGDAIRAWLRKYATYFLIYTTVFGAVTGVGIWFSIQLASPEGTSLLIHQFVFAWAIEWVMFLGELTTLYLYFYGWEKNSRQMQIFLAGAYFVIAWGSLFVINGIVTFMLTPGAWSLENTNIAAGFFNPGFFPSLLIRTLIMFMLGGLFGIIVATRINGDDGFRNHGKVDADGITLLHSEILQCIGELADALVKLLVCQLDCLFLDWLRLPNQGNVVTLASFDVDVEGVVGQIGLSAHEPLVCVGCEVVGLVPFLEPM